MTKLRPMNDKLLVKRTAVESTTASGLYIPDTAKKKSITGEVLAVGEGAILANGSRRPLDVRAGERVMFGEWSGTEIQIDGEKFLLLSESEVLGIVVPQVKA